MKNALTEIDLCKNSMKGRTIKFKHQGLPIGRHKFSTFLILKSSRTEIEPVPTK